MREDAPKSNHAVRSIGPADIDRALAGDRVVARQIIDEIEPVIRARVVRVLARRRARSGAGRDVEQEVSDLAQDVFEALLADGGRVLRTWDPSRGLSLNNFVGLCAEREATSILRSGRRSPWSLQPIDEFDLDSMSTSVPDVDEIAASRETLERVLDGLRIALSPMGLHLFEQLYLHERQVDELAIELSMTRDALYAWRSRLARAVRKIFDEITAAPAGGSEKLGPRGAAHLEERAT